MTHLFLDPIPKKDSAFPPAPPSAVRETGAHEFFELALHDLQNAVALLDTSIRHLTSVAPSLSDEPSDAVGSIQDAQIAVRRLQQYIDHVVTADRVSRGRVPGLRRLVSVGPLIEQLIAEYQHQLRAWEVDLTVDLPGEALEVRGDEMLLRRLLQNLLENCLRHNHRGGSACITARRFQRDALRIEFCNDGVAIQPEMRERIFEKYVSAGDRGTAGVGLYFCRAAAAVHDGTLAVVDHASWAVCMQLTLPTAVENHRGGRPVVVP